LWQVSPVPTNQKISKSLRTIKSVTTNAELMQSEFTK
jgi:hypothetical protein